jgi:protein-L-isoaspartate(D-aspartate) O-methyltransferase
MVTDQLVSRGIKNPRVLAAMRAVPREQFVPGDLLSKSYYDGPLPIGFGQTISQPYIVARMLDALDIQPDDSVLEIGTGSGYSAAVLSLLCNRVYTIERIDTLAQQARRTLRSLGYQHIQVITDDGTRGWTNTTPFDAIVVAASAPRIPSSLKNQLAINARLILPVGGVHLNQSLLCITRTGKNDYLTNKLDDVQFVPLIGAEGWK